MTEKPPTANWNYPTSLRFGVGRLAELPTACAAAGIARPLLVTDPGLAASPMVKRALDLMSQAGMKPGLFSALKPNPVARNVEDGIGALRAGSHDGVVAMGGGSALDTGKVIAFQAGQTRPLWDFEDIGDWWTRANADAIKPVVAIPTTAGTGSEVGRAGVIINEAEHRKYIIFHPRMMPRVVISDPELTRGLPPHLTAATGMDALAHNLEAYCAPFYHPLADGIALEGMRLVKEWLPVAFRDGEDLTARGHMLSAASMGATAFQKGLGAIHAMSHQCRCHALCARQEPQDDRGKDEPRGALSGIHRQFRFDACLGPRSAPRVAHPAYPCRARRQRGARSGACENGRRGSK